MLGFNDLAFGILGAIPFLATFGQLFATILMEQTGLRTVFHHHCGGYVETPEEVGRLMASTNPELLGLCRRLPILPLFAGSVLPPMR